MRLNNPCFNLNIVNTRKSIIATTLLTLLVFASLASAHAPLEPGDGSSIETASFIPDPSKSYVVYSELEAGEAEYFYFEIQEGERIYLGLITSPDSEGSSFLPSMVLMGHGIEENDSIPGFIETPEGDTGRILVHGEQPEERAYEGFTPSTFYDVAELDMEAPETGDYYIAVFDASVGGSYALVIGYRETFTLSEWVFLPFDILSIYRWSGQSLLFAISPMIFVLAAGIGILLIQWTRSSGPKSLNSWIASVGALLIISTGAIVLFQMGYILTGTPAGAEIAITIVLALIPIALGLAILKSALNTDDWNLPKRAKIAVLGVLSIFVWAGYLVGPILAVLSGLLPAVGRFAEAEKISDGEVEN